MKYTLRIEGKNFPCPSLEVMEDWLKEKRVNELTAVLVDETGSWTTVRALITAKSTPQAYTYKVLVAGQSSTVTKEHLAQWLRDLRIAKYAPVTIVETGEETTVAAILGKDAAYPEEAPRERSAKDSIGYSQSSLVGLANALNVVSIITIVFCGILGVVAGREFWARFLSTDPGTINAGGIFVGGGLGLFFGWVSTLVTRILAHSALCLAKSEEHLNELRRK